MSFIDSCGLTAQRLTVFVIISQHAADDPLSNSIVYSNRAETLQSKQHSRPENPTNPRSHAHVSRYLTLLHYILAASCPTLVSDSVFLLLPRPPRSTL